MTPVRRLRRRSVAVIGAGPGGLCAAIRLTQWGSVDVTVFEQLPGVGGTWRQNRYPGAACDLETLLYSFSFFQKLDWPRPYSSQEEILRYLEDCVEQFDLAPHLRLGTGVTALEWLEDEAVWCVATTDGEEHRFDVVVGCVGMFNEVNVLEIPGLLGFGGELVHTARWPDDLTLAGRDVAVIGTGSSAVQVVPAIAPSVRRLYVVQRSAHWVMPKKDSTYLPQELDEFRRDPQGVFARRDKLQAYVDSYITFADAKQRRRASEAGLRRSRCSRNLRFARR